MSIVIEVSWRAGLSEDAANEVVTLADAAEQADGTAPLGEHVLMHLRDDATAHLLAHAPDGALVGFAHLDAPDDEDGVGGAELVVHPEHRRAGLGGRLVGLLLERSPHLRVWAHGKHPGAVALAASHGFTATRELLRMRRGLEDPVPAPELPAGVRLRPFVPGADEKAFLQVNNAAFDWHPEQGGWTVADVELREREPWFDAAGFLLAVDAEDRLLGFHWTKVHGGAEPIGEVYVLGVDPAARGLRLGAALTLAGLQHLRERGLTRVMLYVESDNDAAVRLYEHLGFTVWDADVSFER